jgi:hypothetical protein
MRNESRRPHWMRMNAKRAGRALAVPLSLTGLLLAQPASALSADTEAALAAARVALERPECTKLIRSSLVMPIDVLNSLVDLGRTACTPREQEPQCPGLREVFDKNPTGPFGGVALALSTFQGGLLGRTALYEGFSKGLSNPQDFAPTEIPFPPLNPLEARELVLLHELAHSTGKLGDDRKPIAERPTEFISQGFNSSIVKQCIRPNASEPGRTSRFWIGPAAACGRPTHSTPACTAIVGGTCPRSGVFSCTGNVCDFDDQHVFYQGYLLDCL